MLHKICYMLQHYPLDALQQPQHIQGISRKTRNKGCHTMTNPWESMLNSFNTAESPYRKATKQWQQSVSAFWSMPASYWQAISSIYDNRAQTMRKLADGMPSTWADMATSSSMPELFSSLQQAYGRWMAETMAHVSTAQSHRVDLMNEWKVQAERMIPTQMKAMNSTGFAGMWLKALQSAPLSPATSWVNMVTSVSNSPMAAITSNMTANLAKMASFYNANDFVAQVTKVTQPVVQNHPVLAVGADMTSSWFHAWQHVSDVMTETATGIQKAISSASVMAANQAAAAQPAKAPVAPAPKAEVKPAPQADVKPAVKVEPKVEAKPEVKPAPIKVEAPVAKAVTAPQPVVKPEVKIEPKVEIKVEAPKVEVKPASKPVLPAESDKQLALLTPPAVAQKAETSSSLTPAKSDTSSNGVARANGALVGVAAAAAARRSVVARRTANRARPRIVRPAR
jgi:outer membrane biosynthesis protein TonB